MTTPTLTLRGLTPEDIPALNVLMAAIEAVDETGEHYNEDDLREEIADPLLDLSRDWVGGEVDGELVGYFQLTPRSPDGDLVKVHPNGAVHPEHRGRGYGTVLAEAMIRRAREKLAETHPTLTGRISAAGLSTNDAQADLLQRVALHPERWSFQMSAPLTATPEVPPFPDGLAVRRYTAEDAEDLRRTHNTVFLDHPDFTTWDEGTWAHWVTESRNFRPEHSYLVHDTDGRLVSYVQTNEYDAHFEATGKREAYVAKVGTVREHRGRGIAATLLRHCLAAYRAAGYDVASLDVDSENPTGALGVYQRAGFEVDLRWTHYFADVPPSTSS